MERKIIEKIFKSRRLDEASFEAGGKHYSAAFGRYTRDGESISRDEYFKAKEESDTSGSGKENNKSSEVMDISSMSGTAGSTVRKGKDGPYYYDNGDADAFTKSVEELTSAFTEKYPNAQTVQVSKNQTVTYDEESGYAIVTKKSDKPGKSWTQYKKLNDSDKDIIAGVPKKSEEKSEEVDRDQEDEDLVVKAKQGDTRAEENLIKKYQKLAYHLSQGLFLPGGDQDDLAQEAIIGLVSAIRDYKPGKNKNFKQFAILAMKRNMQDAISKANTNKHKSMNTADDYDSITEPYSNEDNPAEYYIQQEDKARLIKYMKDNLTDWEQTVLGYYLSGMSYDEIAEKTDKNNKSINNAMNSVRSKLRKYKEMYRESVLIEMVMESLSTECKERMLEAYNYLYN